MAPDQGSSLLSFVSAGYKPAGRTDQRSMFRSSPNIHTLIGGANHGRTVGNVKRLLKLRQVGERSIHAKLRRRVRIGGQAHFLVFIPNFLSPDRGERQEEALLRREAVDLFIPLLGMFVERLLQRSVGEFHSADVRDVFALGQLAVYMQAR